MKNEKRTTIRLNKNTIDWLDSQPRGFNFSEFANQAIDEKNRKQRLSATADLLRKGLAYEEHPDSNKPWKTVIVFRKSSSRVNDELLRDWEEDLLKNFLKLFSLKKLDGELTLELDETERERRYNEIMMLSRWE